MREYGDIVQLVKNTFEPYLEYARSVRRPPRVEQVVLAGADKPFPAVRKLERQNARLVQVQLVLVRLRVVEHLNARRLHAAK